MLVNIFLGVSLLNGTLGKCSNEELIRRMAKHGIFGNEAFLRKLFGFSNRQFSLEVGGEDFKVALEKNNKLVLCQLDLARLDVKYEQTRKKELS